MRGVTHLRYEKQMRRSAMDAARFSLAHAAMAHRRPSAKAAQATAAATSVSLPHRVAGVHFCPDYTPYQFRYEMTVRVHETVRVGD